MPDLNKELIIIFKEDGFIIDINKTTNKTFFYDEALYNKFKASPHKTLFYFGFTQKRIEMSSSLSFLHNIAVKYINYLAKDSDIEITRSPQALSDELLLEILHTVPFVVGMEFLNSEWIKNIWNTLSNVFTEEIGDTDSVSSFLKKHNTNLKLAGRVFFHLVENKTDDYPFAFLATYSTSSKGEKKAIHTPLKNALLEFKNQNELLLKLLSTVSNATEKSEFISELVESGELFSPLKFTSEEAYVFLKEIPLYEECGILCRIPDWWKKRTTSLKLSLSIGEKQPSSVGMDALLNFNPNLYLGEQQVSKEEIEQLLSESSGLSFIKGKWVEVDHEKLKSTLKAYEEAYALAESGELTLAEAMRSQLNITDSFAIEQKDTIIEITNGQWLTNTRDQLLNPAKIESVSLGKHFKATLRNYQQIGYDWLHFMSKLGFGALLADDMGLGKTIQILALLDCMRQNPHHKTLLILPASLIGNWQKEIEAFTPMIKYKLLHPSTKELFVEGDLGDANLFITTYGMVARLDELQNHIWDLIVLDEAQAIKNPNTKQTKSIKLLQSKSKIAMTGTPIENKLTDLWSIFDFLNKGLLGTSKQFSEFIKRLNDKDDYSKLRSVVSPFILRRLKTDKSIISDLPEKIEIDAYTTLTKKQAVLYKSLVRELTHSLENAEGIQRKGLVLASIMKFKQICNHPDQYLGQNAFDFKHSGKFDKLKELCETIYEKRERVLVFTQFKEMTEPLANYLESIFQHSGFVLHGGTSVKKRTEMVDAFCGEEYIPFMVLSLKAGGVGLNLTSANHVIHFDRWWNPAIENQATDRAFRIGQRKNVMVHKFITKGTIEEKINEMIVKKQKLVGDVIAKSGETWITELDNKQLLSMFTLD